MPRERGRLSGQRQERADEAAQSAAAPGRVAFAAEPSVLLWQVLGEVAQQLRRWRDQGKLSANEFSQHVQAFRHLYPLVFPTAESFDCALSLAERFSLSHWDSMLLGACQTAGATRLYTEDIGAPRAIDGIELINPFL